MYSPYDLQKQSSPDTNGLRIILEFSDVHQTCCFGETPQTKDKKKQLS